MAAIGGGCNALPPTNVAPISGNWPQFSAFNFSDSPTLAPLPPFHSFWPTPCSLLLTREWAELCAVQKLLNKIISRKPVIRPFPSDLSPFFPRWLIPFIVKLLQIREEIRNLEKALEDSVPPSRWLWDQRSHINKAGWKHQPSNSKVGF